MTAAYKYIGGGIAKHKDREEAEQFMEFLVSKEAQRLYATINYEYPVIDGIEFVPYKLEKLKKIMYLSKNWRFGLNHK